MKNLLLSCCIIFLTTGLLSGQRTITLKGKVQFPDNRYQMEIVKYMGFDKLILDSCRVNEAGEYELKMNVTEPGLYQLSCQKWQSVGFWAEDENLEINFRGQDTARIKIKNPPYVYIKGGEKNELMNLLNWTTYRNYQNMIAVSQNVYSLKELNDELKQDLFGKLYGIPNDEMKATIKYLVEHYADRNSILAVVKFLNSEKDAELIDKALLQLESKNPGYAPLKTYKKELAEAKAQRERLAVGKMAPEFLFSTPDGKKQLGPENFRGKYLIIDFWASWCGPCRAEIPNLKKNYELFHNKGVDFLSVSIDKDDVAWRKAMGDEAMPWEQVLAPGAGKDIMKEYQFSGIPYIILLDKEGRIAAKNLRGKGLTEKLEQLLTEDDK